MRNCQKISKRRRERGTDPVMKVAGVYIFFSVGFLDKISMELQPQGHGCRTPHPFIRWLQGQVPFCSLFPLCSHQAFIAGWLQQKGRVVIRALPFSEHFALKDQGWVWAFRLGGLVNLGLFAGRLAYLFLGFAKAFLMQCDHSCMEEASNRWGGVE